MSHYISVALKADPSIHQKMQSSFQESDVADEEGQLEEPKEREDPLMSRGGPGIRTVTQEDFS